MANETKPLLITGERLLLALDILLAWVDIDDEKEVADERFSLSKIHSVFQRLGLSDPEADLEGDSWLSTWLHVYDEELWHLHRFLDHPTHHEMLATVSFDLEAVFDLIGGNVTSEDLAVFQRFLCGVAVGELTEADFRP